MKKVLTILFAAVLAVCLCAGASAQTELTVFAAALLTETLTAIKGVYETATGVVLKVDRSGQALVLAADGGEKRIAFEDIRRVRAAEP